MNISGGSPKQQQHVGPSKPKRAATAVLTARPRRSKQPNNNNLPGDFRILMVKRSSKSSFMRDIYVFPGGSVDENDFPSNPESLKLIKASHRCTFPSWEGQHAKSNVLHPTSATDSTDDQSIVFAYRNAALREIFEESGLLGVPTLLHPTIHNTTLSVPSFLPIDLDHFYKTSSPTIRHKLEPLFNLSYTLKLPQHEVFRRIIHLNDQETLDSIFIAITAQNGDNSTPTTPTGFLDLCQSLEISTDNTKSCTVFDTLLPIAKWIAPISEKKRFDTNFYLSLIDPDRISFCPMSADEQPQQQQQQTDTTNSTTNVKCVLDDTMAHFHRLSVREQSMSVTDHDIDPTCRHGRQLMTSTLSQEISDINFVSPIDMLDKLDQIALAPPTQYILAQLSGLTMTELQELLASPSSSPVTFGYNDSLQTQPQRTLVPIQPLRLDKLSTDPFTYTKSKAMSAKLGNQPNELTDAQKTNTHFSATVQHIGDHAINTKGYVLLPQDLAHPLTEKLLLRLATLYQQQQSPSQVEATTTTATNETKTTSHQFLGEYDQISLVGDISQTVIDTLLSAADLEDIIINQMSPALKLSNVDLYQSPTTWVKDMLQKDQQFVKRSGLLDSPVIEKWLSLDVQMQKKMEPFIHFHRVVDGLDHNNWEIVTSNPKIVWRTRDEIRSLHTGVQAKM
jgi:8-oxo-dGTP pyrophosphatase MutT (NUDIX family)